MSEHMRKHHTEQLAHVYWHNSQYSIPVKVLEKYKDIENHSDSLSMEEVFSEAIEKYSEPALLLKGLRAKEGLTQKDFAKLIYVTQANLSAMENGRRNIGKEVAKRINEKFGFDYRLFL